VLIVEGPHRTYVADSIRDAQAAGSCAMKGNERLK
jgi:hypothetical protein